MYIFLELLLTDETVSFQKFLELSKFLAYGLNGGISTILFRSSKVVTYGRPYHESFPPRKPYFSL